MSNASERPYDLLLKCAGGTTFDPSTGRFLVQDIAIAGGKIVLLKPDIDPLLAKKVCLVPRDGIAMPGWIDPHVHIAPGCVWAQGMRPEPHCLYAGCPRIADAGSMGINGFGDFHRYIIDRRWEDGIPLTDVYAFLNIAAKGLADEHRECFDLTYLDPERTAELALAYPAAIVGIKVRLGWLQATADTWENALALSLKAAELSNRPLMVHINEGPPIDKILERLRPGDIITHCFHGRHAEHGCNIMDDAGKLRTSVAAALKRGVYFDLGHGQGGYRHAEAVKAVCAGVLDIDPSLLTVSTDLHRNCVNGPVHDFATTLMKALAWPEVSLATVLQMATINTVRMLRLPPAFGCLAAGSPADLTICLYQEGEHEHPLVDAAKEITRSRKLVLPYKTVRGGVLI